MQTAAPALFAFMGLPSSSVGLSVWRWACASPRFGSRCFRSGQRKAIIRTHLRLEIGSDYIGLVQVIKSKRYKAGTAAFLVSLAFIMQSPSSIRAGFCVQKLRYSSSSPIRRRAHKYFILSLFLVRETDQARKTEREHFPRSEKASYQCQTGNGKRLSMRVGKGTRTLDLQSHNLTR